MIKTLFTDLGDVMLFYDFKKLHEDLSRYTHLDPDSIQEIIRKWLMPAQIGKISGTKVIENIRQDAGLKIGPDEVRKFWNGYWKINFKYFYLLDWWEQTFPQNKLYLISNINVISWQHCKRTYAIFRKFDGFFLSYQVKLLKPDPRIFILALKKTGANPQTSLFVDDNEENIRTAKTLGFQVWHYSLDNHGEFEKLIIDLKKSQDGS